MQTRTQASGRRRPATSKKPGPARASKSKASARSGARRGGSGDALEPAAEGDSTTPEFKGDGRLYYRIGEVSRITDVKPYVLRYWETEFRWMSPQKSRSKQRLYRVKDIETILLIKRLLYEERYTIAGARRRLRELGAARSGSTRETAADRAAAESTDPRVRLGRLRHELQAVRDLLKGST